MLTSKDLKVLLDDIEDTHEVVLQNPKRLDLRVVDERFAVWSAARAEANIAYEAWRHSPGRDGYAAYRAAEDRADAAEEMLAGGVKQIRQATALHACNFNSQK